MLLQCYARVVVNVPQISGVFDYHLPPDLNGQVEPGCLVVVPFGRQMVQGIVLRLSAEAQVAETRPVMALLDPQPVVTPLQMRLAEEMAAQTLSPLAACLGLMLPPGMSQMADTSYRLAQPSIASQGIATPLQQRLLALLAQRGDLRGRQLEVAFRRQNWRAAVQGLVRRGWVYTRPVLPPPSVRPKTVRTVQLACPPETALARLEELGRGQALARRQAIIRFLLKEPWPVAASWAYAASGGNLYDLYKLAEMGLVVLGETEVWRDPLETLEYNPQAAPPLTSEQEIAWQAIRDGQNAAAEGKSVKPILLQGVTGSGKTEVYLQAVAETLRQGRQAIILVPEIAITPQTLRRFAARFPGQVGLVHSRLSAGERYDTWRRARAGLLPVLVGPRSALFSPLPDPGLIVIDECHDDSYSQSDQPPVYHAVAAAAAYARLAKGVLILGSATPDVNLVYRAQQEKWNLLRLPARILAHRQTVQNQMRRLGLPEPALPRVGQSAALPLPGVQVVDMRQELKAGNHSIFSRALYRTLGEVLQAKQQAILFLNRRGSATYVFCRSCGYSLRCPRCDLPLTYHTQPSGLVCHSCNYRRAMPAKCPQCGGSQIRQFGTGTEKVESEVRAAFPSAGVLRWDAETTRQKGSHEILLSHFINQRADILVGTQMLAKGLDLPLVTLVGVILADVGLNLPDFRAGERTFQLLTQVAGRAGRSPLGGKVILQTFQPDHYVIQMAAGHDQDGFYARELEYRRQIIYPPFARLARLEFRHLQAEQAEAAARALASELQHWIDEGQHPASAIIGPAPCFYSRLNGYYRWQIVLRSPDPAAILRGRPLGEWRLELDPPNLL